MNTPPMQPADMTPFLGRDCELAFEERCVSCLVFWPGRKFVDKGGLASAFRPGPGEARIRPPSLEHRRGALFEANAVIYEGLWPKKASNGGSLKKGLFEGRFWHPFRVKTPNLEPSNALGYIILGPFRT